MRFHIGFSKRISIKTILTLISALFVGLLAFLGIAQHEIVFADTLDISPSSFYYYNNTSQSSPLYPTQASNNYTYNYTITNPGSRSFNFTYLYNFSGIFCSSGKANLNAAFFFALDSVGYDQSFNNFSITYNSGGSVQANISVNSNGNGSLLYLNNVDLSKVVKIVGNSNNSNNVNLAQVDRVWNYTCVASDTSAIISNQNQNTQDIIDNQNNNTQDIIDNQNANNQAMIDSQKVCKFYDKSSIILDNSAINTSNGNILSDLSAYGVTDYINISYSSISVISGQSSGGNASICFYNRDKTFISCVSNNFPENTILSIPSDSFYIRVSIRKSLNKPSFYVCRNGNQAVVDSNNQLNDSLNDSNVDSNIGTDFFDMNINEHGIASILTSPIRLLQALTTSNNSCNPLNLTINLDGTSKVVSIPSGCILWDMVPSSISSIFVAIVYGLFAYYVLIDLYKFVHGLLDPDDKNMYVLDL